MHFSLVPTKRILQGSTELMSQINKLHLCCHGTGAGFSTNFPSIREGGDAFKLFAQGEPMEKGGIKAG